MERLAIIGAGVMGRQALEISIVQNKYSTVGFYDDFSNEDSFENIPILGKIDQIESDYKADKFDCLIVAIGYSHLKFKEELIVRFQNIPMATIAHPSAIVEQTALVEPGCLLYANSYVGPRCTLKKGGVLNLNSTLSHDVKVSQSSFISVGVNIGGNVDIGKYCFIGIGSVIANDIHITNEVFIGAGAVVTQTINKPGTYVGVPAKFLVK